MPLGRNFQLNYDTSFHLYHVQHQMILTQVEEFFYYMYKYSSLTKKPWIVLYKDFV